MLSRGIKHQTLKTPQKNTISRVASVFNAREQHTFLYEHSIPYDIFPTRSTNSPSSSMRKTRLAVMDRRSQVHHRIFGTTEANRTNRTERWKPFLFFSSLLSPSLSFESHAAFFVDEKIPRTPRDELDYRALSSRAIS
jgi:hypothetical protein